MNRPLLPVGYAISLALACSAGLCLLFLAGVSWGGWPDDGPILITALAGLAIGLLGARKFGHDLQRTEVGKVPRIRLVLVSLAITLGIVTCLALVPLTFEVHDLSGKTVVTSNGARVARYGFSRLHLGKAHFAGKDAVGDMIDGRCFIDVMENGRERRTYGWRLTRSVSRALRPERRVRTLEVE